MKRVRGFSGFLALLGVAVGLTGCATTNDVNQKVSESQAKIDKKIESVETQIEALQEKQKATEVKVDGQGKQIDKLSQSAADALKRAQEAGILAKGKVVFEQTFAEDRIHFKTSSHELDKDAKAALDEFAKKVKALDKNTFIEIQGHTDDTGSADMNDTLGQRRAESVRRYLSRDQKLALGRMSTISYGDGMPVDSNKTKAGRAKNRRVVIIVLE
jgi:peptidoglycan-associated lipoprotein